LVACGGVSYWFALPRNQSANLSRANATAAPGLHFPAAPKPITREISSAQAADRPQIARVVYPYSIVPGGIASVAELRSAIARDYVVFDHYSTFHLDRARIIRLDQDRLVHVSYRIGDRVYWTKRALRLRKGEALITDGEETARTRCGNMISKSLGGAVSPNEPTEPELNAPVETPHPSADLVSDNRLPELVPPPPRDVPLPSYTPPPLPPVAATPWSGGGSHLFIPLPEPTPRRRQTGSPTPPPVVSTPEPGTAIQFLVGALAILFLLRRAKRKGTLEGAGRTR
jgi:hypothetical protein